MKFWKQFLVLAGCVASCCWLVVTAQSPTSGTAATDTYSSSGSTPTTGDDAADLSKVPGTAGGGSDVATQPASIRHFLSLISADAGDGFGSLRQIANSWRDDDAGMLIEAARFSRRPGMMSAILGLLADKTGQQYGSDFDDWYRWIWNQDVDLHPNYATFKRELYRRIDPRFAEYFSDDEAAEIRLDEIRWGGVLRDGIPPLSNPETIPAARATYLNDADIVFGVSLGGQSRAYPKRILAWHEMVKDHVGGQSINGVYCTLCGSMIVYDTRVGGKHYELGTSGFLYRSNKLMYDHETKSMWSTLKGQPVVGPLVGKGIQLDPLYVVTTTWGQWKQDHPDTDVLSLRTGHRRDYGEGVAYRDYFSTDRLMFTVPKLDRRLKNKDEVLIVRAGQGSPIAIDTGFLNRNRIFQGQIDDVPYVILTGPSGANRVYQSLDIRFTNSSDPAAPRSDDGVQWRMTEDALVAERPVTVDGKPVERLQRLPAHRAFWFGWFADHPDVQLIQ